MRRYTDIVEIAETVSRRRANQLLEAGYELLDISTITFPADYPNTDRPAFVRRHEYVIGRIDGQRPISDVLAEIQARADAGRPPAAPLYDPQSNEPMQVPS